MAKPIVACVVGTRPEAIKMAPVVLALREHRDQVETLLVSTGQHREMLEQALKAFDLAPDHDLAIMQHGQTLAEVTARALAGLDGLLERLEPQMVVGQGDTTTTFCAFLAAFYRSIASAHVEAGLRTDRIDNPFPEEFNRRAAGLVASVHFPPTHWAADNLRREGKAEGDLFVTGNTGIDAVQAIAPRLPQEWAPEHAGRVLVLTTHRRENWGEPQREIARAARTVVDRTPDTLLIVPMHRNPRVREVLEAELGGHGRIQLIEPPEYPRFVKLMQRATLILTDSGGVQEEAPAFGVPVLVLRETTERPEGVDAGTAKLVGTDRATIEREAFALLSDETAYRRMANAVSPYGDGKAARRIASVILRRLGLEASEVPMWG
jgi:UDP-N-acetylglucosamine 2-epimerase (non-hydrolysing)